MSQALAAFEIDLPADWDRDELDTPQALVLARPRGWRGAFTPTVTVGRSRVAGIGSLGEYRDVQLAGLCATIGGHVVHLETGHRPHAHLDLVLALDQLGHDVTIAQRHLVELDDGGRPGEAGGAAERAGPGYVTVVATAVAADEDWPGLATLLLSTVRSVRAVGR